MFINSNNYYDPRAISVYTHRLSILPKFSNEMQLHHSHVRIIICTGTACVSS